MRDPMNYSFEQLVRALVVQTMGEASLDNFSIHEQAADEGSPMNMADKLYHNLKGLSVDSEQTEEVLSKMAVELDRYSFSPAIDSLIQAIEQVVRAKYRDDPEPIIRIVTKFLGVEPKYK